MQGEMSEHRDEDGHYTKQTVVSSLHYCDDCMTGCVCPSPFWGLAVYIVTAFAVISLSSKRCASHGRKLYTTRHQAGMSVSGVMTNVCMVSGKQQQPHTGWSE